jgi:hypothetical protein
MNKPLKFKIRVKSGRTEQENQNLHRKIFNPLVIIGALLIGIILFGAAVLLIWYSRPVPVPRPPATPVMVVVAAPTATHTPLPPTPTPVITPSVTPNPLMPPAPAEGVVAIGAYVQISGTGRDGLRLRMEPGLDGRIRFLGLESEVFIVRDGPQQVDDFTWWYLTAPVDENRAGWAVSNYLEVVQNP